MSAFAQNMLYNEQSPNSVLRSIYFSLFLGSKILAGLGQFLVYFILEPEYKRASQAPDTHITFPYPTPHPHPTSLTSQMLKPSIMGCDVCYADFMNITNACGERMELWLSETETVKMQDHPSNQGTNRKTDKT